jgi:hypothetical protein
MVEDYSAGTRTLKYTFQPARPAGNGLPAGILADGYYRATLLAGVGKSKSGLAVAADNPLTL